jgi:hypothetical protein
MFIQELSVEYKFMAINLMNLVGTVDTEVIFKSFVLDLPKGL